MITYKIIGGDQREYGPVTAEAILQWVAEGRANGSTLIQRSDSPDWRALSEYSEFRAAAPTATGSAPATPGDGGGFRTALEPPDDFVLGIGACVRRGASLVGQNPGLLVGASLFMCATFAVLGLLGMLRGVGWIFNVAALIVTGPILGGVFYLLLRLIRGQTASMSDLGFGFSDRFVPLVLADVVPRALTLLACLPGAGLLWAGMKLGAREGSPIGLSLVIVGVLVAVTIASICALLWIFTIPLVVDRGMHFWTAMKWSQRTVLKHPVRIGLFLLLLFLIYIAGAFLCGVGILVTLPIGIAALLCAYDDIFGRPPDE